MAEKDQITIEIENETGSQISRVTPTTGNGLDSGKWAKGYPVSSIANGKTVKAVKAMGRANGTEGVSGQITYQDIKQTQLTIQFAVPYSKSNYCNFSVSGELASQYTGTFHPEVPTSGHKISTKLTIKSKFD